MGWICVSGWRSAVGPCKQSSEPKVWSVRGNFTLHKQLLASQEVSAPCNLFSTALLSQVSINTTINIYIAKSCFYIAVLTTTCFGRYIGHHQVVHSLIFKPNYTIYNVFVNEISCTSIKSAFFTVSLKKISRLAT